ncbi:MAG TPA: PAS domain-containing sensor histidine kinase [Candidatus Lustribacter sp.]|nr:PAS domain-containing sensor histidine kinase [Candidatus Lustribacter sp.]
MLQSSTTTAVRAPMPVPMAVMGLFEMLPDGLVVIDKRGIIRYLNSRAARILGTSSEDLLGREVRVALPLRTADGCSWWDCTNPWEGLHTRTGHRERLLSVDGEREVLVTAQYIRPARGQPVERIIMSLRDAAARQRAEADHAALISTVAHELRSPLTSVKGFSATLLRRWDRFTDDQKRFMLQTIEADADRVTRLITELLDVSRIDAGRLTVHRQPVDLVATLDRHVSRFVASGLPADRFVVDVAPDLPEVWADPDRLDQILLNLIENALRHGEGTVTLGSAIDPGHPHIDRPPAVVITVGDEGQGIAEEDYPLIFSRFWHGSRRGSTGLGLYVVRGLVEAHGGQASVGRAPGGGAEFRFTLPSGIPS